VIWTLLLGLMLPQWLGAELRYEMARLYDRPLV
jgi:hypothetical protein